MQDKFHVAHSLSPSFNNLDPRFYDLIIKGWREVTTFRDSNAESIVDAALRAGQVEKVTFREQVYRVRRGQV